ncbi:transmembrane signal peptide protein [Rhodanobacter sp. FW510-R12]|uniref:RcnB family protein n=1 Tax=unclassified Rhodanobacter TaxID=2621553 RepID=UPI0007A9C7E1|nr:MULTISPECIES: RcnB family protein [unclassified Rhodanobacter]KZC18023.1 transmembrane signal peptide protein [Rhodanobacter sp. FW104-R8]KZC28143.1 transmembrane signal peptide protein [Rhodanobacter sp. FW510-T8]KZC33343.1 transmembrane signal peptide protein [Rhodanobacter sp. FW510-R10]
MKLFSRLLIALALLATGSLALADQGDHDRGRRGQGHGYADHRHDGRHGDHRRYDRRYDDRRYGHGNEYPRLGHHPRWQRGHHYYGPTYVVHDYGHYRLRPPPRGYHWVRANNDYLLVAIATGIILDVALR